MWEWLERFRGGGAGRQALGARGERVAARHLRRQGYRILGRNLRSRLGEIDIVARDPRDKAVVIVEVKTGRSDDPSPEVHVNRHKKRKLTVLADQIIRRHHLQDQPIRFDVIAVVWPDDTKPPSVVRHHENAFDAAM